MRKNFKLVKADTVFMFDPKVHMHLTLQEKKNLDEIEAFEEYQWFVEVSKLKSGDCFGELALIDDKPRAATITCITDCQFATLGDVDYNRVLAKQEIKKTEKKIQFMK